MFERSKEGGENLRKHVRISWGFIIKSKPEGEDAAKEEVATVLNISEGGCYFGSSRQYQVGQILELKLKLPGVRELLLLKGIVRRCDHHTGSDVAFVGVEFLEINQDQKIQLSQSLSFLIKKFKGQNE